MTTNNIKADLIMILDFNSFTSILFSFLKYLSIINAEVSFANHYRVNINRDLKKFILYILRIFNR